MGFDHPINLFAGHFLGIWAPGQDGVKTLLHKLFANPFHGLHRDLQGFANLVIRPTRPVSTLVCFKQDVRPCKQSGRTSAGGDYFGQSPSFVPG